VKANDEMKMLDRIDTKKAAIFNIHLWWGVRMLA
jgi:hypothetical protein